MATITTKDGAQIFFKAWGDSTAQPIVFHHGWPLSADEWDSQMLFFLSHGYRVIAETLEQQLFGQERTGAWRASAQTETLRQAIRDLETKFDPNQPRAPVGSSNGGQWVDLGHEVLGTIQAGSSPRIVPMLRPAR